MTYVIRIASYWCDVNFSFISKESENVFSHKLVEPLDDVMGLLLATTSLFILLFYCFHLGKTIPCMRLFCMDYYTSEKSSNMIT